MFMGILISTSISCTPDSIMDDINDKQACCENEGTIELPPPPPPPEDDTED
ncbi:hypothetical protein JCM19294_447 [Nonlabens tegetincola]|uniref:Uncharacterized protein n=1 Tax=Nonlabens tegetincola TaxID=323273 RepID=A0A090QN63_9FLAO|nr:hypothetical protein JCM19294_447 [Nonlabens tegetincola]